MLFFYWKDTDALADATRRTKKTKQKTAIDDDLESSLLLTLPASPEYFD